MTSSYLLMTELTAKARTAARHMAGVDDALKAAALIGAAQALRDRMEDILAHGIEYGLRALKGDIRTATNKG